MFSKIFSNTVYIRVHPNKFELKNINTGKTLVLSAIQSFTTKRQLIGEFTTAEELLKKGMKQSVERRFLSGKPVVVIQPMSMIEGGLSQVEERVLQELAVGSGARKVKVWVGHELSDNEVLQRAESV